MRSFLVAASFLFVTGLLFSTATTAKPVANITTVHPHQFARVVADASVPVGWTSFCKAQPAECEADRKSEEAVAIDS